MRNDHYFYKTPNEKNAPKKCDWRGCDCPGEYRAPKRTSNGDTNEYYMFCLEHVRIYNKNWNYFDGMSPEQIEAFQKESLSGHRPTKKMGVEHHLNIDEDTLRERVFEEFGFSRPNQKESFINEPVVSSDERRWLAVLNLNPPVDWENIKKRYKQLAKSHHPDLNDDQDDEKLKLINHAYSHLKKIYST